MAFGFSPKYTKEVKLENFNKEHFLIIAIDTAEQLEWNISFVTKEEIVAYSGNEEIIIKLTDDSVNFKSETVSNQLFDFGNNKDNIESFLETFENLKSKITIEELEIKLRKLKENYSAEESRPPINAKSKIDGLFSIFKPREDYFITPIIIILNILTFILMIISGVDFLKPTGESIIAWGANFRPLTLNGQWWRLITNCFLHIGVLHLLLNMYALLYIGLILEPYLGKTRFLAAYLISGIASSVASLYWHELTISAGASGAIFGMYGVFLALLTTSFIEKSARDALMTSIVIFVGYNILNGFKSDSGIDNAAHIGGLISGLIIGYSFLPSLKPSNNNIKHLTIVALSVALILGSVFITKSINNDFPKYQEGMKKFVEIEAKAVDIIKYTKGKSDNAISFEIRVKGIFYWKENIKLIDSFEKLDLPLAIRTRNTQLKKYCELRIKSYELIYKGIDENTNKYDDEISSYNKQIEKIITDLTGKQEE